jgi:CheY-like chemotaxis protein
MAFTVQTLLYSQRRRVTPDGESPEGEHTPPEGSAMDPPARIVLVEDEAIAALDVARRLRRLGYQVVAVANSGLRAIEYAFTCDPDVVLMDIHLQGAMDGVDAARHIQAAAPIPVVYMSAQADAATITRLQATTQAAEFVPKPIHLPTLHATLQRACSRPQGSLHR